MLWEHGGVTASEGYRLVPEENLSDYIMHSFGFWSNQEMPYIICRPSAVILSEAGIVSGDRLLLMDIYELSGSDTLPTEMPRHCKELMMLRMHCMRDAYVMQFEEEYDLVHGKVMFAIKDSRDFVVFDVSIPSTQQEIEDAKMKAHEHMLILSNHYLTSILDREANDFLDNRCHLLGAVCPQHVLYNNECPQCENPPVPFQNVRNGYRIGTHLVNTRDASWGSITNEKYIIAHRDDQNKMMTRYVIGYGCEVLDEDGLPLVLDEILTQDSSFEYELKTEHTFKHPRVSYKLDITLTMVVRDPYGHGYPVAYCMCSGGETAAKWSKFLRAVVEKCNLDPEGINFMLDKSTACIAALKSLKYQYVLCIFHVMQAWGRHLRNAETPNLDEEVQKAILNRVRKLIKMPLDDAFDQEEAAFKRFLLEMEPSGVILKYYEDEWSKIDDTWSKHGRQHVREMQSDTNNLIEKFFRSLKRDFLNGMRAVRRDILITTLLNATAYPTEVLKSRLRDSELSNRFRSQQKYDADVIRCRVTMVNVDVQSWNKFLQTVPQYCDVLRRCDDQGQVVYTCMGDLSCTCESNESDICMHVEAMLHDANGECLLNIDNLMAAAEMIKEADKSDIINAPPTR